MSEREASDRPSEAADATPETMTIQEFVLWKHGVELTDQQARELEEKVESAGATPIFPPGLGLQSPQPVAEAEAAAGDEAEGPPR